MGHREPIHPLQHSVCTYIYCGHTHRHTHSQSLVKDYNQCVWCKIGVRSGPVKCGVFSSLELAHRKRAVILGSCALLRHTVVFSRQRGRKRREEEDGRGEEVQARYPRWITARKPCSDWYVRFWPDVLSGRVPVCLDWIHPLVRAADAGWKTAWSATVSRTSTPDAEVLLIGMFISASPRLSETYVSQTGIQVDIYDLKDYVTGK